MKKSVVRRSITIPKELDDQITIMSDKYSYNVKNELYVELLELGTIKYNEDIEMNKMIKKLLSKVEVILKYIESK